MSLSPLRDAGQRYVVRYRLKGDAPGGHRALLTTNEKPEAVGAVKRWRKNEGVEDVWLFDVNAKQRVWVD